MLYVWRRGISSASTIYLILRYTSLLSFVVTMLNLFPFAGKTSLVRLITNTIFSELITVSRGWFPSRAMCSPCHNINADPNACSCNVVTRLDSSMDAVVIGSSAGTLAAALALLAVSSLHSLSAFSALRAYALCGSKPISILVLVIAAASSIPSFVRIASSAGRIMR